MDKIVFVLFKFNIFDFRYSSQQRNKYLKKYKDIKTSILNHFSLEMHPNVDPHASNFCSYGKPKEPKLLNVSSTLLNISLV